ncbi:MAG TPA: hypothetical protein V6D17_07865 [Candidatus Obscuribacterales bacterium]
MIQGHIPEQVIYVSGASRRVQVKWDDLANSEVLNEEVIPCFPVDAASEQSLETARQWAGYRVDKGKKPAEERRDNKPFEIRICGLEVRERGGRAYKVVTGDGYWFDLREDVLLDAILQCGISKGGKINAQFIWGKLGSQMKLVRVGSALHTALIQAGKRKATAKVKGSELQPGGVYRNVKGERFLVIGWVSTIQLTYNAAFTPGIYDRGKAATPESASRTDIPKQLLFVEIADWQLREHGSVLGVLEHLLTLKESFYTAYFKLQKSLTVMEHEETVELPEDILARVRTMSLKCLTTGRKDTGPHAIELSAAEKRERALANAAHSSELANVQAHPAKPQVSAEFEPFYALFGTLLSTPGKS